MAPNIELRWRQVGICLTKLSGYELKLITSQITCSDFQFSEKLDPSNCFLHPEYSETTQLNDFCLIKLDGIVSFIFCFCFVNYKF